MSIPLGVIYKFFEDQGNYLAAILTYYAFIAIFPLMLLATSILGFFLEGRPELQEQLLDSALSQFPIIGDQLGRPGGLQGSAGGVISGLLVSLYGAMGLGQAIQNVQNVAWYVPRNSRPNPILLRLKSVALLSVVGVGMVAISVLATLGSSTDILGKWTSVTGVAWLIRVVHVLLIGTVLTLLFRVATAKDHHLLRAAPGAFFVAVMWQVIQHYGAVFVAKVIVGTSEMTQVFGVVLGLIGLLYAGSVAAVFGVALNVVLALRLYPRALLTPFTDHVQLTDGDRRAYTGMARAQRTKDFADIQVRFGPSPLDLKVARESAERAASERETLRRLQQERRNDAADDDDDGDRRVLQADDGLEPTQPLRFEELDDPQSRERGSGSDAAPGSGREAG
ncbi:YihY/virulence factor BrkB family protein [Nocardioides dubius]|uniref:YihY/virulence factor BrkB family protein n=1 Tax=Nocardioides dubius TaxID=317019 RepID=UPI0031DCB5EA